MANEYPEAGFYAQPEVQAAIERFRALPESERAKTPLLWWLLQGSTQLYKMSKQDALYTDWSKVPGQTCGGCRFLYYSYTWKFDICSQVKSGIAKSGWCKFWEAP